MKVNKIGLIDDIIKSIKIIKYQLDDNVKPYTTLSLVLDWCKELKELLKKED